MNDLTENGNDLAKSTRTYEQVLISVANPETAAESVRLAFRLTTPSSVLHIINVTTEAPFHKRAALWRKSSQLVMEMTQLANRLGRVAKPLAATSPSIPASILNVADDVVADLIILGWFGEVTPLAVRKSAVVRKVLDKADCDTIVLKSRSNLANVERLIVPIHENYSRKRLALAQTLRQRQENPTELVLVHVLTPGSHMHEDEAQKLLDEPAARLAGDVQTCVVQADDVVRGIIDIVDRQDLIVVGPGREWVFSRFLYGHNADQLANRAPCSVLMYRAKGRKVTAWFLGLLKALRQRLAPVSE